MADSLLITGPPGSGKSRAALELFLSARDAALLTPTATMAEHVRHELARAGVPVRPNRVMTLAQFVEQRSELRHAPAAFVDFAIQEALAELRPARFAGVAEFPGFRHIVAALIEDAGPGALPEDVAQLLRHVQRWLARRGAGLRPERLASAARSSAPAAALMVFDGFFEFSPAELRLLESLGQRSRVIVTLPSWSGSDGGRNDLLACGFAEQRCGETRRHPALTGFSAATMERETEEIARQILEQVSRGRPFREMGIVLRAREPYAAALETTFARFGIPARFYFVDPLAADPAVEYVSRLIAAMLQGWDHATLLSAIRMPVSGMGATAAGDHFDFALREKLPGLGLPIRGIEDPPELLATLGQLTWARDRLDPAGWSAQLKMLRTLAAAHNRGALDALEAVLDQTAELLADRGRIGLGEFWEHVRTGLGLQVVRPVDRRRNVVHVMDVFEARQWELPIVFVCGMVERHFPQYHREDPLLGDAGRRRAGMKTSADLQREERFLFEVATTRATEQTVLSFARFDEKGEEALRSFFLQGFAIESCEGRVRPGPERKIPLNAPVGIRRDGSLARLGEIHRRLAATAIETFLQCPFQFFASRTMKLNPRPAAPRDRLDVRLQGSILHRALAELANVPLLGSAIFDEVFADECRRRNVPATYRTEAVRLELLRHFEGYLSDEQVKLDWATRVEEKFEFALSPLLTITGRVDRLEIGPRNEALVVDYKYSAGNKIRERVEENTDGNLVQGGLYLAAAQRAFRLEPAGMLYCGLRKEVVWDGWHVGIAGLERIGESRTHAALQELIDAAIAKAADVFESIASGQIAVKPADAKKCVWCDFRDMCRVESAERPKIVGAGS